MWKRGTLFFPSIMYAQSMGKAVRQENDSKRVGADRAVSDDRHMTHTHYARLLLLATVRQ